MDYELTKAQQSINGQEEKLTEIFEEIEQEFHLLGATAVEDTSVSSFSSQLAFFGSNSRVETSEQCVKSVQS